MDWGLTILSVAGSTVIGWISYLAATKARRIDSTASPYDQVVDRVGELETGMRTIQQQMNLVVVDRDAMARYIYDLAEWERRGRDLARPTMPLHLKDAFKAAGVPWPEFP